jgi:ATP-dependent RNA helicase RhlE
VHTPVTGAAVFGGVSHGPQEHAFRSGVDVLIATPGRLLDHLRAPYAKLGRLEWLVLDEADRMLDMGFLPEIRRILRHLPARRQTLCFSATMPPPIRTLTGEILHQPVVIARERATVTPAAIVQAVYPIGQDLKPALLLALLRRGDIRQALVFTRTKHRANRLADALVRAGVRAGRIHSNRSQTQRTAALATFRSGATPVLVATDIAARGIDVEDLAHVVNFDVPVVADDYIHRIGRTGRAEASGEALTFMAPEERAALAAIERAIGRPLPRVTLPDFDYAARPAGRLEIPLAERLAALRAQKALARARAAASPPHPAGRPGAASRHGAQQPPGRARAHGRRPVPADGLGGGPRPGTPSAQQRLTGDVPSPAAPPRRRRFRPRRRR